MTEQETVPDAAGGSGDTATPDVESLREALAVAEATSQENWGKYLRAAAELDNVRKRAARDVEQARKFGIERLAGELLAVLDSIESGLAVGQEASVGGLAEGQQATLRLLRAALERFGVTEVMAAGQAFDPQLHEALSIQAHPGAAPGSVLVVIQKGYQINGRLLRPARVVVAGETGETGEGSATPVPADGGPQD
ncbi:MAG: nucleotide exchange factor GrpE [Gammaproteobacteria bacterium]|nr:nucleotide exchange factor GrpE [Gammaproteobacteria bacterium]